MKWNELKTQQPISKRKGQGYFRFYTDSGYKEIIAVNGQFEINGIKQSIIGLPVGFQTLKPIEGVQFKNKLYFATGTKLVEYDGSVFKIVEPYKPKPFDALYIGINALADDPNQFMTDGEALSIRIDGLTFSSRYGYMNTPVTLTAYISKPYDKTLEYQFEWRTPFMQDGFWEMGKDWSSQKTWDFTPSIEGDIQFRVSVREKGNTIAEAQYLVPKFKVKAIQTPEDEYKDVSLIHQCTRIFLHWGRLYLYGDPNNPKTLFFSHLNNPAYFPMTNNIDLENKENEGVTTVVQYRDMLIGFTDHSIQAIYGKGPSDMKRITLNTEVGCIAPDSAKVLDNIVIFLSSKGIYYLESVGYTEEKGNVSSLDTKISNLVTKTDRNAKAVVFENQYHILFSNKKRLKFYQTHGCWTKDESERFTFDRFYVHDNMLMAQDAETGAIYKFDPNVFTDDGTPYQDKLETPYYHFGSPYQDKKMKMLEVVVSPKLGPIQLHATVFSDYGALTSIEEKAVVNENGEISWQIDYTPNLKSGSSSKLGEWIMGESKLGFVDYDLLKLRVSGGFKRSKLKIEHEGNTPNVILGWNYRYVTSQNDRS